MNTQEQIAKLEAEESMVRGMMDAAKRSRKHARAAELLDRAMALSLQIRNLKTQA